MLNEVLKLLQLKKIFFHYPKKISLLVTLDTIELFCVLSMWDHAKILYHFLVTVLHVQILKFLSKLGQFPAKKEEEELFGLEEETRALRTDRSVSASGSATLYKVCE